MTRPKWDDRLGMRRDSASNGYNSYRHLLVGRTKGHKLKINSNKTFINNKSMIEIKVWFFRRQAARNACAGREACFLSMNNSHKASMWDNPLSGDGGTAEFYFRWSFSQVPHSRKWSEPIHHTYRLLPF